VLFNQSIKENLLYGKPDATDAEMQKALEKANAWAFVTKLVNGINTSVGSTGGQLSGGQKQRIALARAFIKNPSVLILDEATSALDRKNEAEVQAAIDGIRKADANLSTIIIAHRLSTIKDADTILVMKKGKLVEQGSHDSLLALNGEYANLVKKQEEAE
jgi:ABC-type multidrug transport system fused ATPase/permease subunit